MSKGLKQAAALQGRTVYEISKRTGTNVSNISAFQPVRAWQTMRQIISLEKPNAKPKEDFDKVWMMLKAERTGGLYTKELSALLGSSMTHEQACKLVRKHVAYAEARKRQFPKLYEAFTAMQERIEQDKNAVFVN